MINCVTISKFKPPLQIIKQYDNLVNYNFIYDDTLNYNKFILNNPIDNYNLENFNKAHDSFKRTIFVLYYLYISGGIYIDLKVIPSENIININFNDFSLLCVKSIFNNQLFLGVLGCKKNEPIILELIKELSRYENSEKVDASIIYDKIQNLPNILILNEKKILNDCISTVNLNGDILFNHYFNDNEIYKFPFKKKERNNNNDIKIGITLSVFDNVNKFFSNGINQNCLYLAELLLNIGFDVFFILNDSQLLKINEDILKVQLYDSRFKFVKYSDILTEELDVFITLSFSDSNCYIHNYLKYMDVKLVGYFCGNSYIIDTEKIVYNQHKNIQGNFDFCINKNTPRFDEIWCIPQMADLNFHYWKILYKCDVIVVPFIWSKNAIKLHSIVNNCSEDELMYKNKNVEKKIAIFEPNISIMKWALPSVLICENCHRNYKNIKHLYITNINSSNSVDFNMDQFNKIMAQLDLTQNKKCSIEHRYNTLNFMRLSADVVVSHQWGNPLNYIYFDLAWLGYPVIHNAELCKDLGYYYNSFDYTEGSEILNYSLNNHDNNIQEYILNNRNNIDKYLTTNKNLMENYENFIHNLLKK
jgi:hypothetical protein